MKELYSNAGDRALAKVLGIRKYMPEPEKKVLPYPDNLVKTLRIDGLNADTMTLDQKAGLTVAVGQLRDRQQRAICLKYEEHKKNDEIGKIMNRAAGTIGTYHTKAMRKLRGKNISVWYLEGYETSIRRYFAGKGWKYGERVSEKGESISGTDYCLRLGISLKQFDALIVAGIETVFDLTVASGIEDWYKPIKGIGPKTAQDLQGKLDRLFISRLEHARGDDDYDKR